MKKTVKNDQQITSKGWLGPSVIAAIVFALLSAIQLLNPAAAIALAVLFVCCGAFVLIRT